MVFVVLVVFTRLNISIPLRRTTQVILALTGQHRCGILLLRDQQMSLVLQLLKTPSFIFVCLLFSLFLFKKGQVF